MASHIYLDDLRDPHTPLPWVVVRGRDELIALVEREGFPEVVSLDHDLGEDVPSGMDCARWLVEQGIARQIDPRTIEWNVHSANPVGAANIRGLYRSWIKFWEMEQGSR